VSVLSPEAQRRLDNQARLWRERYAACTTYEQVVRVAFDRARAAARAAERGGNAGSWEDLANLLSRWCEHMEQAQAQRAGR
jgi:N-acetyl-beta-hexosaminidase